MQVMIPCRPGAVRFSMRVLSGAFSHRLGVCGLFVALLMTAVSCGNSSNADQPAPVPTPVAAKVEVSPVVRQDIRRQLAITGSLLPNTEATVSAEVSGRITKLNFDVQQFVRKGDVLAALDDTEYRLQVAQAKATLAQAHLTAERAGQDLIRDTELIAAGDISQRAFDISKEARDAAKAQQDAAEAAVTLAEKRLRDTTIRAPITGLVTERMIDVGDYVKSPAAIAVIMHVNPLKLRMDVPERFAASVRSGQRLTVSVDAYPGRNFEGRISRINPAADPSTRTFSVEAVVPNPEGRLKPGFFAKAVITTGMTEQALVVPADAVVTVDDQPAVFIARNGAAVFSPVKLGVKRNRMVQVVSGVTEADSVLVSGHTTLTDGAPIQVVTNND